MLKISPSAPDPPSSEKTTPNLLPCRIHRTGPVDAAPRYWNPKTTQDGALEAYIRGRKLRGRAIKVPEGYRGVVVKKAEGGAEVNGLTTQRREGQENGIGMLLEDEQEDEEVQVLEEVGSFDEIVLWGHERMVEDDDEFVRGLEEWTKFAEVMHRPGEAVEVEQSETSSGVQ